MAVDKDKAAKQFVEVAFDDAYTLREEYSALVERRRANREQLRSLQAQGHLSPEQSEELAELYPVRTRGANEVEAEPVPA